MLFMLIIVSGFAGSGKSTLAEGLGKEFGLKVVHASHLLKELATKSVKELDTEHTEAGSGFWESADGKKYLDKRSKDTSMDKKLDRLLLKIADEGNVVLDSWTMPWLCKKGFKIWIETSALERAKRVAQRDNLAEKEVLEKIMERDKKTAEIYRKLYGFEIGKDLKPFHLVIQSDGLEEKKVLEIAVLKIKESVSQKK